MVQEQQKNKVSVLSKRFRFQIIATMAVHIITFTHGVGVGWTSPSLRLLQSDDSPFGEPVSVNEASWIGSMIGLGSMTGNIVFGLLLDRIGRKWCMNLIAVPNMLYWILIYCSQNVAYLYAGRFCAGLTGGGSYVVIPIFIGEIADTSIRGALSSFAMFYVGFGMIIGMTSATFLSYRLMPCIIIALPILFLLAIFGLKDTPQYLLKRGRIDDAEQSYRFYKNMPPSESTEITVVETTQNLADKAEFETFKGQILKGGSAQPVKAADFVTREALKTFGIIFVLMITNQFSGSFAIFNYTSHIFAELGNKMEPNICTIIVASAQILGTCCTILLVDRFGRRSLFLISVAGMGLGMLGIGLFKQFASEAFFDKYDWLPLLLLCLVAFIAAIGVISLIFVIIVELLPAKIRSLGTSFSMTTLSFLIFCSLKIYPTLIFDLGLSMTMYISAGFCLFGFIVLGLFLPETKGKSMAH